MREALDALGRGEVVAAATESFFGLFADLARSDALNRLLELKPRGLDKGIPVVLPAQLRMGFGEDHFLDPAQNLPRTVEHGTRVVPSLFDIGRIGRAFEHGPHLLGDRCKEVSIDFKLNRVHIGHRE